MAGKKKFNNYIILTDMAIMFVKHNGKNLKVMIDEDDIKRVIEIGSWHAILDKTLQTPSFYIAHRYNNKGGKGVIKLHRLITNCPNDKVVDHINHNTLDNRKINLRVCSRFENQQNLRSKKSEQTGVYQRKNGLWVANISKGGVKYYKEFKEKANAIKWRKEKELELYKEVMQKWQD